MFKKNVSAERRNPEKVYPIISKNWLWTQTVFLFVTSITCSTICRCLVIYVALHCCWRHWEECWILQVLLWFIQFQYKFHIATHQNINK